MSHCRAVCPRRGIFPLVLACLLLFSALPRLSEAQAPDHLLISEVVYDPPGAEPDGEWVELFNPTAAAVSLAGWLLKDGNAQDALPDHTIPPGGYVVVATSAAAFRAAYPTYSGALLDLGSPIGNGLSNSGDALMLVDAAGVTVDALSYGTNTSVFMPPCPDVAEGHSLARVPPTRDTDTAADWIDQPVPDPGTAGSAPPATPTETVTPTATLTATPSATPSVTPTAVSVGAIVINEIMQNPQAVADTAGEWLELYNAGATAIDLNGWELRDAGADHHTIDNGGPLWLAPGGYMVLGRNADPAANGGVTLAYRYSGFTLGNAADAIILLDPAGREVDRVAYDGGPTFPNPNGASMQLVHPSLDNSIGANWRVAITPWPGSAGDSGSPGAANHTAQIEGYVYEDSNANRVRDAGEAGIADVLLTLTGGRTTRTLASGWYAFSDLAPGSYVVTESQPAGYVSTTEDERSVTVALGQVSTGHNFGEQPLQLSPTPTSTSAPGVTPTATPSATATAPPVTGPWPRVLLSEVLYDPWQVGADADWEFVELYNADAVAVELSGWQIADAVRASTLPAYRLLPGHYLVVAAYRNEFLADNPGFAGELVSLEGPIGNGLSNTGDVVRLLAPDGQALDEMSYGDNASAFQPPCAGVSAGQSLARVPSDRDTDTAADWMAQAPPNPGAPGHAPTPTPTHTATPTDTPPATATPTPTGMTPAATPTPTATPTVTGTPPAATPTATPAPTATPFVVLLPLIRLNEVLPRPDAIDWDGNGTANAYDEWIELYSLEAEPIDLAGWQLDDIANGGTAPYTLPTGAVIPARGYLVIYRSTSGVALNQDADTARLIAPGGHEVDTFSYVQPRRDVSYSRTVDGVGAWTDGYPPSPGRPNLPGPATATPTAGPTPTEAPTATPFPDGVVLNEVLAHPFAGDWDASGVADYMDEWIELYNMSDAAAQLGGWQVMDDARTYTIPRGVVIWPHAYLLLFRAETRLALGDYRDRISLLRPDGVIVDEMAYDTAPGYDRSLCRASDGVGEWSKNCLVTPGRANQLRPPREPVGAAPTAGGRATAAAQTIAAARRLPIDTRVTLVGAVTLPPGVRERTIYIQDESGGIRVYLRAGDYPRLALGDRLRITGWTREFYGEAELSVPDASYITQLDGGAPLLPEVVPTGLLGEAQEGRLISVSGRVVRFERRTVVLDDGSGPATIYFAAELAWPRPYVRLGETWSATGLGGRYVAKEAGGGYQLLPRFPWDMSNAPLVLPVTGGGPPRG